MSKGGMPQGPNFAALESMKQANSSGDMSNPHSGANAIGMSSLEGQGGMSGSASMGDKDLHNQQRPGLLANSNLNNIIGSSDIFDASLGSLKSEAAFSQNLLGAFDGSIMSQGNVNAFAGMDHFNAVGDQSAAGLTLTAGVNLPSSFSAKEGARSGGQQY